MGGLDQAAVATLVERARRGVDEGLTPSCQLALARDGKVVLSEVLGDAGADTRYVIFSATKGVVAGAVWLLIGEGTIDPGQKVVDVIPEFGANGKDVVTIDQVLQHTSGFPRAPMGPDVWSDRQKRLQRFAEWGLNWEPGTQHEYHPTSAHWVLAELIERASGIDYRDFIRVRIAEPLGLTGLRVGVPPEEQGDIASLVATGEAPDPDELERLTGFRELPLGEVTEENLLRFNEPEARAVGVPGGGGVARAVDLALYYQALLHNTDNLWDPEALADGTGTVRNLFPDFLALGAPANRTRGLVVAGDDGHAAARGFGHTTSPRAFGHNGAGGQIAWADPESGLSFCYLTNGMDANLLRSGRRGTSLSSKAAVCASEAT